MPGGKGPRGRGGIDTDACFLTERAIIKLESIRVLIACMLLTQMSVLSALLHGTRGHLSPKVYYVRIGMRFTLEGF